MNFIARLFPFLCAGIFLSPTAFAKSVVVEAAKVKFSAMSEFPGLETATVEGASTKGPHHSFTKFNAGFSAPMHFHSSDHFAAVITGTLVLTIDGVERKLTPGSYFSFTDKTIHSTKCELGADCLLFLDVRNKWDVVPVKQSISNL